MGILFGVFHKVETYFLGTLEKSVSESCQESYVLWWDYVFLLLPELLGKDSVEFQFGSHLEI